MANAKVKRHLHLFFYFFFYGVAKIKEEIIERVENATYSDC